MTTLSAMLSAVLLLALAIRVHGQPLMDGYFNIADGYFTPAPNVTTNGEGNFILNIYRDVASVNLA
jgi:hypothetical protein